MERFTDRLVKKILQTKSHVAVGLDPVYELVPSQIRRRYERSLEGAGQAILEFNTAIIDAVADLVPAVKPQVAFYEKYGIPGLSAFAETVVYAKRKQLVVIEDAKRNDIGSTATAYSQGHIGRIKLDNDSLSVFDLDAITVNPYLGSDGILPFVEDAKKYGKGIFVLVKTSNPSSGEFQDLEVLREGSQERLSEVVARMVDKWGSDSIGNAGYSAVGAVVGATYPGDAARLRSLMPKAYFLVPGYGTQGGDTKGIVPCFNKDGLGALVAASRSIIYAYKNDRKYGEMKFAAASREEVVRMNTDINRELKNSGLLGW